MPSENEIKKITSQIVTFGLIFSQIAIYLAIF